MNRKLEIPVRIHSHHLGNVAFGLVFVSVLLISFSAKWGFVPGIALLAVWAIITYASQIKPAIVFADDRLEAGKTVIHASRIKQITVLDSRAELILSDRSWLTRQVNISAVNQADQASFAEQFKAWQQQAKGMKQAAK